MEFQPVFVKSNGKVSPKTEVNPRQLHEHQIRAMENLDIINREKSFSTLVVLPTGAGKTYTASLWLMRNALDKKKKVLWIAHRQMLLDQAAECFQKFAFTETMPHISGFHFRVISGSNDHDRTIDIKNTDDLLIVGKDSLGRNLPALDAWLKNEEEIFFVVDEAHHSTAKTYRKVMEYVKSRVKHVKVIGLTATPFRTAENEQGLLSKIYTDGVGSGKAKKNELGITYKIDLTTLINRGILSTPRFTSYKTGQLFGEHLGLIDLDRISNLDILPEDISNSMIENAARNKFIVDRYRENRQEYGKTIVFAINVQHAIALSRLFNDAGISSDFVVSDIRDAITGVVVSREENERKLERYKNGEIEVLVNVNILTEGADFPQTKTVFLTRPTVSKVLMTQMIGRALRGEGAGGTREAHIVSFIDNWQEQIAWVNPESLFDEEKNEFNDMDLAYVRRDIRLIAISKIEEFASSLDQSVNTAKLESIPFEERIPLGMYAFNYVEENGTDHACQVMVYNSTQGAYRELMEALPDLFAFYHIDGEFIPEDILQEMLEKCEDLYFSGEMLPPYRSRDISHILNYYAKKESVPTFYPLDQVYKNKLDVSKIAKKIYDEDMGVRRKAEYVDEIWNSVEDDLIRVFFSNKIYFINNLDNEILKISHPDIYKKVSNTVYGTKELEDLSLWEMQKIAPNYAANLKRAIRRKFKGKDGLYFCAICGYRSKSGIPFQVDHIIPLNKGGKSLVSNLQLLCRRCNGEKGDR